MCTFSIPMPRIDTTYVTNGDPVTVYNDLSPVWSGYVATVEPYVDTAASSIKVTAIGPWGYLLRAQGSYKPWADSRFSQDVWGEVATPYTGNDVTPRKLVSLSRNGGIRFNPRSTRDASGVETGWGANWYHMVRYIAPPGETIKMITANYNQQNGSQNWQLQVYNVDAVSMVWNATGTGSGLLSYVFPTPPTSIAIMYRSMAAQTPPTDGTVFGEMTNIRVFCESPAPNTYHTATTILRSINVTGLSTDKSRIYDVGYFPVMHFIGGGRPYADIITDLVKMYHVGYPLAAYCSVEELPTSSRMVMELVPDEKTGTPYYWISYNDANTGDQLSIQRDSDSIRNYVSVSYTDYNGMSAMLTPVNTPSLKDDASITAYGKREVFLTHSDEHYMNAQGIGEAYLKASKDMRFKCSGEIVVRGYINSVDGSVPVSKIKPGRLIAINNFLGGMTANGVVFLIARVEYDDDTETARLMTADSQSLDSILASTADKFGLASW